MNGKGYKKKIFKSLVLLYGICISLSNLECISYAKAGDLFYFGGVTEGRPLAKTIEEYVTTKSSNEKIVMEYKELVFFTGKPEVAECEMEIKQSGDVKEDADSGMYTINYVMKSVGNGIVKLDRDIKLDVKYRKVNNQIIKDYKVNKWDEDIKIESETYTLNAAKSDLNLPTIEYIAPGITYYKTTTSNNLVYDVKSGGRATVTQTGQVYGCNSHWSSVETQDLDVLLKMELEKDSWQLHAKLTPNVTANKSLTYDVNKPVAIGFSGNYIEIIKNRGGINYNLLTVPSGMENQKRTGTIAMPGFSSQEQLVVPINQDIWHGNFAEEDIKKLYSLEILEGNPKYYVPNQALTRSQYVRILVRALGLRPYDGDTEMIIFEDVTPSHTNYGYIVTAYERGIIKGVGTGEFNPDEIINREEAFVIYMRALGLERLASDFTVITPFLDDDDISFWAKRDIMALYNLGLVQGDGGKLKPKAIMSKAEGAALVNRMIDYLRSSIQNDYIKNVIEY